MSLKNKLFKYIATAVILYSIIYLYNENNKNKALLYSIVHLSCTTNTQSLPWDSIKFPQNNSLIYRFSEHMCDECIFQDLAELRKIQEKIGKEQVWVLCDFENNRINHSLFKNKLHDFNYMNIPSDSLSFPLDQNLNEKRFFATINAEGHITTLFYPQKNRQNLTAIFLECLVDKL